MVAAISILSPDNYIAKLETLGDETKLPTISLRIQNYTAIILDGATVESVVEYQGNFLVFLTNDIPYEEQLNIYYISSSLKVMDQATLGSIYVTGSFKSLQVTGFNQVSFTFFGTAIWTICMSNKPFYYLPFINNLKGVSRPFRLRYYFKVLGSPQPDRS